MSGYLFSKGDLRALLEHVKLELDKEINGFEGNYLLNTSETDICNYLLSKYRFDPPVLRRDELCVHDHQETDVDASHDHRRLIFNRDKPFYIKGTSVTIAVPFNGDGNLFHCSASTFTLNVPRGQVVGQELRLTYTTLEHDANALKGSYEQDLASIEQKINWVRNDVDAYNGQLPALVEGKVRQRKQKLLADAGLVGSLGIPIRRRDGEALTFSPMEIKRKPAIRRPQEVSAAFQPELALPEQEFDYILKVIENMVLVMERSPRAFVKMDEESLRDHILVQLNGHYEGQVTGETFNYTGKTDILIRCEGKNVFIAECKFWKGPQMLLDTLDQLLGYTSWRDTKAAVLVFNRNRDHTAVLQKVSATVPTHTCYKRTLNPRSETHFRYVFHQRSDTNREVFVAVLVFHVPVDPGGKDLVDTKQKGQ